MTINLPFLSEIYNKKNNKTQICLIHVVTKNEISLYNLKELKPSDRTSFLSLVSKWWKTASYLPISIYYQDLFDRYEYCKHHYSVNDLNIISGFEGIKLKNLSEKRIKRKIIHLEDKK